MRRKCGFCVDPQSGEITCLCCPTDVVDYPMSQSDVAQNARIQGVQLPAPPRMGPPGQPEVMTVRDEPKKHVAARQG